MNTETRTRIGTWVGFLLILVWCLLPIVWIISLGIAAISTTLSVILATLAAYAIARLDFRGKKLVLSIALAIAMFPVVALVGPLFDLWRTLGLFNTWPGLIIPYMSFTLPLAIW